MRCVSKTKMDIDVYLVLMKLFDNKEPLVTMWWNNGSILYCGDWLLGKELVSKGYKHLVIQWLQERVDAKSDSEVV